MTYYLALSHIIILLTTTTVALIIITIITTTATAWSILCQKQYSRPNHYPFSIPSSPFLRIPISTPTPTPPPLLASTCSNVTAATASVARVDSGAIVSF